jgi:hypothetical protein
MKRIVIIGGGTFNHIRNHMSLAAPAFGTTAKKLYSMIWKSKEISKIDPYIMQLVLTKMASHTSSIATNKDLSDYIDKIIKNPEVNCIIMSAAVCDYEPINISDIGSHGKRLETSSGNITLELTPSDKIIAKIRKARPDIFLIGFKTTTGESEEDQFLKGLKMMKATKCNLVLANDTITRKNMVITPEETMYGITTSRTKALKTLVEILTLRLGATYTHTTFNENLSLPISECSSTFQTVVKYLIDNKGFIENNGNGFTPGHFCERFSVDSFVSSQRKANHNLVFQEGMSLVEVDEKDEFIVTGKRKASVGAKSQWLLLSENPDYDCIVHTHNLLKKWSLIPTTPQKPFQCGSTECGINTASHLGTFGKNIKAVFLEKHGANIMFKTTCNPQEVINFINDNLILGEKCK